MRNLQKRWKLYGIAYFTALFALLPSLASAYIDPSVTTYAIQAIAGVAVAAGAFFAHRMLMKAADEKYCLNL